MSRISLVTHRPASLVVPVAALAVVLSTISCAPTIPRNTAVSEVYWLDQKWSDAERHWAHHAGQGTATLPIPYQWFVSLEQPSLSFRDAGSFTDPSYLSRFGFIPSPTPGGVPVVITSPASSSMNWLRYQTRWYTP